MTTKSQQKGMTLLELLLVLGMLIALLAMIWNMMQLYSGHYLISERKVSRAQLVRSVSQMLNDDLAAAVQDPIHSLPTSNTSENQFIRHFGLRGDSRSLQIDVVQPNLFAKTASVEENRQAASGLGESPNPQVPELKTIFYEFVPINAREKLEEPNQLTTIDSSENVDLGSKFVGSLNDDSSSENSLINPMNELDAQMSQSLVQKYGLSRYELDFETVDDSNSQSNSLSNASSNDSTNESAFVGSLSDTSVDSLINEGDSNDQMLNGLNFNANHLNAKPYLTATQLAMDSEDGTVWIPEVIDCRFRYFDGKTWFDHWDSIEKNGLPIAIEVSLKLLPLDDIEILRNSPQLVMIPEFDSYKSLPETNANEINLGSAFVGSLQSRDSSGNGSVMEGAFANNTEFFEVSENFDPFATEANGILNGTNQQNVINGVMGNADSSNNANGSQSLDSLISELGLSTPMIEQVISYLPTTPLAQHQVMERRKPVAVQQGYVQPQRTPDASGRRNVQAGERQYRERTFNERSLNERSARDRQASNRTTNERQSNNRQESARSTNNRLTNERVVGQRTSRERSSGNRSVRDRMLSAVAAQEETVSNQDSSVVPNDSEWATIDNEANNRSETDAVPLPGLTSPTEIISDNSVRGFSPTDSSSGISGTVPNPDGTTILPTQTSRPAQTSTSNGPTQSWIRGKTK